MNSEKKLQVVILSGGFDPVHSGHIAMFREARKMFPNGIIIVGVNSDEWLIRKKGYAFMNLSERTSVLWEMKSIDSVVIFDDNDNTAIDLIESQIRIFEHNFPDGNEYYFLNGGDRGLKNTPEMEHEYTKPVHFLFGVGGDDKRQSSSKLVERIKET